MKFYLLFLAVLTVTATAKKSKTITKPCKVEPLTAHPICAFYPPNCLPPICVKSPDGRTQWFGNDCCLDYYNNHCPTKHVKVNDSECNPNSRPQYEKKPCSYNKKNLGTDTFADVWGIIQKLVDKL